MTVFQGVIGFAQTVETSPGVYRDEITEVEYFGEFLRSASKADFSQGVNPNLSLNNRISILEDPFVTENASNIRYVKHNGVSWAVTGITYEYPRIVLTFGSVWNG